MQIIYGFFAKKKKQPVGCFFAVRTRLELATPCVTGMYSNQLNYRTNYVFHTSFSKAGAKVLLFFELTKYFCKKMHFLCVFFEKCLEVVKKWCFFLIIRIYFVTLYAICVFRI